MEGTSEHIAASSADLDDSAGSRESLAAKSSVAASAAVENGSSEGENGSSVSGGTPVEKKPQGAPVSARKLVEAEEIPEREPVQIDLRSLLQAGVHFGHQTARWSPKMAPFIHGARNGIHIVSLPQTIAAWTKAREAIIDVVSRGGSVLFVGTKKQAQDSIMTEARRCGSYYVSRRWLGGMMTNFQTIRKSISRMNKLEEVLEEEETSLAEGSGSRFTKKERLMMARERDKLYHSLGGIKDMYAAPQLIFVVDIRREDIAVKEATRLDVPVVALVDTNCDPNLVTHPIPSNDDGTRAIRLFCCAVADAVLEGKKVYRERKSAMEGSADIEASMKGGRKASKGHSKKGPGKGKPAAKAQKPEAKAEAVEAAAAPEKSEDAAAESSEAESKETSAEA